MWTPAALESELRRWTGTVWRVVETQYAFATMRLTDSLAEQALLESLLEDSKPPLPPDCEGLGFLLATPFRYAPYPEGSRFRRAHQPDGAFYASEHVETAIAESAFYALLFYAESPGAQLPARAIAQTAFAVRCTGERTLDLTEPQLDRDAALWTHPTDYGPCQDLADAARAIGTQALRYASVRDSQHRANVALLTPRVFRDKKERALQSWHIFLRGRARAQAWCESPRVTLEFTAESLGGDPRLLAQ